MDSSPRNAQRPADAGASGDLKPAESSNGGHRAECFRPAFAQSCLLLRRTTRPTRDRGGRSAWNARPRFCRSPGAPRPPAPHFNRKLRPEAHRSIPLAAEDPDSCLSPSAPRSRRAFARRRWAHGLRDPSWRLFRSLVGQLSVMGRGLREQRYAQLAPKSGGKRG